MPVRTCEVTAVYRDGSRHTLTVTADSLYRAVLAFNSAAVVQSSLKIPRPEMDTQFEVRIGERVLSTDFGRVMAWANRKAEADAARLEKRQKR